MKQLHKKDINHPTVVWFKKAVKRGYFEGAKYLQKKVPLDNLLFQALSAIDPVLHKTAPHQILKPLRRLPNLMTNVLLPEEIEIYESQILTYMADLSLPLYKSFREIR